MSAGVAQPPAGKPEPLDMLGLADGIEVRFKPNLRPDQQRLLGALGVRVIFDNDGYSVDDFPHVRDTSSPAPAERGPSGRALMIEALADGHEHTSGDLCRATGGKRRTVAADLSKMVARGDVVRVRRGVYRSAT